MKSNLLLAIAIVAILIVFVNLSITLTKLQDLRNAVTGLAGSLGYVNVTVNTQASISFTNDTLTWGSGIVNTSGGWTNATLTTNLTAGSVTGGNWSGSGKRGLTIENQGNLNVSVSLNSSQSAAGMFGGTAARQAFQWNITAVKVGSCLNGTSCGTTNPQNTTLSTWYDVNTTTGQVVCDCLPWGDTKDLISIDILLRVPDDAVSTGVRSATITATAIAI